MRVEVLSPVCISTGVDAYPGEIHELPDHVAQQFIRRGLVREAPASPAGGSPEVVGKEPVAPGPAGDEQDEVVEREPSVEHRDPRRGRGRKED